MRHPLAPFSFARALLLTNFDIRTLGPGSADCVGGAR